MTLEQAQELYSDYHEGALTPAMRLAFEQTLTANEQIRNDYASFAAVYAFTNVGLSDQVEVPIGFRSSVLQRASVEGSRRQPSFGNAIRSWFFPSTEGASKRITGGAVAVIAVTIIAVSLMHNRVPTAGTASSFIGPSSGVAQPIPVIQGVSEQGAADGSVYHMIHVHLPESIAEATVTASRVTNVDETSNAQTRATLSQPVLKQPKLLTNDEQLLIPVAFAGNTPDGTTLNVYVQWQPSAPGAPSDSQVVFTPAKDGPSATVLVAPTRGSLYDMLQYVCAEYGVTIIAEPALLTSPVNAQWPAQTDASAALESIIGTVGAGIKSISPGTYLVYRVH